MLVFMTKMSTTVGDTPWTVLAVKALNTNN